MRSDQLQALAGEATRSAVDTLRLVSEAIPDRGDKATFLAVCVVVIASRAAEEIAALDGKDIRKTGLEAATVDLLRMAIRVMTGVDEAIATITPKGLQ